MVAKKTTGVPRGKKDTSPQWHGSDNWSDEQFLKHFHEAQEYYRLENTCKEAKYHVINWMSRANISKDIMNSYKKTKDWRTSTSVGGIAANLIKGMPVSRKSFNNGKSFEEYLKEKVTGIIRDGVNDVDQDEEVAVAEAVPALNIQGRIKEHAGTMCEEIEEAIDNFILSPDKFNPGDYKIANMLRSKSAKGPQARYIKSFYEFSLNNINAYLEGTDEYVKESYKNYGKKNVKKLLEFYENIMTACDQVIAEAKIQKKPRKKKAKPAEEQVKKIKFKLSDDQLGVTSAHPATIVGASSIVVYNVKTRKIGYYYSESTSGIAVKGAGLINYSEKSVQKTLRKPQEQIKEFKDQNTQKRFENWFAKIKTTDVPLNGRLNEDTIILKVYK